MPLIRNKFRKRLADIDIIIPEDPDYKVVNLVVSADIGQSINLDLALMSLNKTIYEPEIFPGLIFRMEIPEYPVKCVCLVFSTAKFVIAGINDENDIEKAIISFGKNLRSSNLLTKNQL